MSNSGNRYFEGLLVGGTLGLVIGLLTAPKPGAEMRRELADSADDLLSNANGNWEEVKTRFNDKVQPIAERASELRTRVSHQAADLKVMVSDKASELKDKASELKDQAVDLKVMVSDKAHELKDKADELKEKAIDLKDKGSNYVDKGKDLVNDYMGNNSGPMYTAGAKANPGQGAHSVSDAGGTYSANKPEAAGG